MPQEPISDTDSDEINLSEILRIIKKHLRTGIYILCAVCLLLFTVKIIPFIKNISSAHRNALLNYEQTLMQKDLFFRKYRDYTQPDEKKNLLCFKAAIAPPFNADKTARPYAAGMLSILNNNFSINKNEDKAWASVFSNSSIGGNNKYLAGQIFFEDQSIPAADSIPEPQWVFFITHVFFNRYGSNTSQMVIESIIKHFFIQPVIDEQILSLHAEIYNLRNSRWITMQSGKNQSVQELDSRIHSVLYRLEWFNNYRFRVYPSLRYMMDDISVQKNLLIYNFFQHHFGLIDLKYPITVSCEGEYTPVYREPARPSLQWKIHFYKILTFLGMSLFVAIFISLFSICVLEYLITHKIITGHNSKSTV
ncbi:MAG TPA: hypothetical protein DC049_03915 [Spirochaetia bacterium]|nr:hypothetical protein [Spirochaetia bacterium]